MRFAADASTSHSFNHADFAVVLPYDSTALQFTTDSYQINIRKDVHSFCPNYTIISKQTKKVIGSGQYCFDGSDVKIPKQGARR